MEGGGVKIIRGCVEVGDDVAVVWLVHDSPSPLMPVIEDIIVINPRVRRSYHVLDAIMIGRKVDANGEACYRVRFDNGERWWCRWTLVFNTAHRDHAEAFKKERNRELHQ